MLILVIGYAYCLILYKKRVIAQKNLSIKWKSCKCFPYQMEPTCPWSILSYFYPSKTTALILKRKVGSDWCQYAHIFYRDYIPNQNVSGIWIISDIIFVVFVAPRLKSSVNVYVNAISLLHCSGTFAISNFQFQI